MLILLRLRRQCLSRRTLSSIMYWFYRTTSPNTLSLCGEGSDCTYCHRDSKDRVFWAFWCTAYLVSDQGKAFTGHVITHLCELYGVQKLRTSPYHAHTNGQVERMNQTIICMIGKLEEDRKACWSEHLPELLLAYNATCSAVTGYSPYYLLFGRRPRIPVDYLFPTLHDSPHQTKMEVSVVAMQKRLKEAFTVARCLTSEKVARQCHYYDRKAGAVALQPGDVVMVCTDGFVGKQKVKDQ